MQQTRDKVAHALRDMVTASRRKNRSRNNNDCNKSDGGSSAEGGDDQSIASSSTTANLRSSSPEFQPNKKHKTTTTTKTLQPSTITSSAGLNAVVPRIMPTTTIPTVMPTTKRVDTSTTTVNAIPRQIAHHVAEHHHHHFNSSSRTSIINPGHMRPQSHHIGRNIERRQDISHQNFASSSSDQGGGRPSQASPVRHQQGSERSHHEGNPEWDYDGLDLVDPLLHHPFHSV